MKEVGHISKKTRTEGQPALAQLCTPLGNGEKSTIYFSPQFPDRDFRLIEVTDEILNEIVYNKSECLKMIGTPKNPVVLCSEHETFSVKKVETSNTLYIVDASASINFSIESINSSFYELKNMPGNVDQLESLLSNDDEELSFEDIEKCVQASKSEISIALKKLGVVELNGKMRMLSKQATLELTSTIFDTIIENNWKIESIDEKALIANLPSDINILTVRHILGTLGEELIEKESSLSTRWKLDRNKVLRASAHLVFTSPDSGYDKSHFPVEEFVNIWATKSPGVGKWLDLESKEIVLLKGIAMKEHNTSNSSSVTSGSSIDTSFYRYYPVDSLPRTPKERFQQLFTVKAKFQLDELEPYLIDLFGNVGAGQCKTQPELLLKYTKKVDGFYYLN